MQNLRDWEQNEIFKFGYWEYMNSRKSMVYERMELQTQRTQDKINKLREEKLITDLKECTFKPKLNKRKSVY